MVESSLDLTGVEIQSIVPGEAVYFDLTFTPTQMSALQAQGQLIAAVVQHLKENGRTFDGITIAEGILEFERAEVEDFEFGAVDVEDGSCGLAVPYFNVDLHEDEDTGTDPEEEDTDGD